MTGLVSLDHPSLGTGSCDVGGPESLTSWSGIWYFLPRLQCPIYTYVLDFLPISNSICQFFTEIMELMMKYRLAFSDREGRVRKAWAIRPPGRDSNACCREC